MKTKKEVIEFVKSELSSNNSLILATLGSGGSGLNLIQNQDDDIINNFTSELEEYSFDGLVDACDDIRNSEYYNENCEVYQFSDNNRYSIQIVTFYMIREEIGSKIAQLRKEAGLSQRDLADKAGLTQNTIYKIENGKFSVGIDVLDRVAKALNRKIDIV